MEILFIFFFFARLEIHFIAEAASDRRMKAHSLTQVRQKIRISYMLNKGISENAIQLKQSNQECEGGA